MASVRGTREGYLQLHKQSTLAKKGALNQAEKIGQIGTLGGVEAYVAHLERQLSKTGSAEGGAITERLKLVEASLEHMEKRMAECFELIQGTQDFCEEFARDTHARFEDARGRVHRCERACKSAYNQAPRVEKLEAFVREENRNLEQRLLRVIDERCQTLEETLVENIHNRRADACFGEEELGSLDGMEGEEGLAGFCTWGSHGLLKAEMTGSLKKSQENRDGRSLKSHSKDRRKASKDDPFDERPMSRVHRAQQRQDSRNDSCMTGREREEDRDSAFEKQIRDSVEEALSRIAEAGRLAAEKLTSIHAAERAADAVERGPASTKTLGAEGADSKRDGAVFPGEGQEAPSVRERQDCTTGERNESGETNCGQAGRSGSLQLEELKAAVLALQSSTGDIQRVHDHIVAQKSRDEVLAERLTSLESTVVGVSGAIQRLTSLESTVAGVSGAIQRLPSLEESFRRATDRIKELSESSQQEKDALYAKQEQISLTLSAHVDAVASLQARVDDIGTLLLDGKGDSRPDVRQGASPSPNSTPSREKQAEDKRIVEGWMKERVDDKKAQRGRILEESGDPELLNNSNEDADWNDSTWVSPKVLGARSENLGVSTQSKGAARGLEALFRASILKGAKDQEEDRKSAEESRGLEGLERGLKTGLSRAKSTSRAAHVRFSDEDGSSEAPVHTDGESRSRSSAPYGNAKMLSPEGSLWALQNAPPRLGVSPEAHPSKGAGVDSPCQGFDESSLWDEPRERVSGRWEDGASRSGHVAVRAHGLEDGERDEGSAYSRALAKMEERKRRVDKLYRELASTPICAR